MYIYVCIYNDNSCDNNDTIIISITGIIILLFFQSFLSFCTCTGTNVYVSNLK